MTLVWGLLALPAQGSDAEGAPSVPLRITAAAPNPYRLAPFKPSFPTELEYAPMLGREYDRSRRQALQQIARNLQGNVRRESWKLATEFFWRAPEDAVEPLIEAMDRAMGNPALGDVVGNCVEAMGKMANPELDAALQRALQHKKPTVRQAAYVALCKSGSEETLRHLIADFIHMDGRARQSWLSAVRVRLPNDRVELLKAVMMASYPTAIRDQVLTEAVKLPAAEAADVLRGHWSQAVDSFKAIIAGALHAAGDNAGTAWLHQALSGEDLGQIDIALKHCVFGPNPNETIGRLREDLLRATTHIRPEVRLEAARRLTLIDGEDVADVFEVLSSPDEVWDIRSLAVRELTKRGRDAIVTVLLAELPAATGGRLRSITNQLAVSGDARAIPVLVDRFQKSPTGKGRPFLQAIAQNASPAAARALCRIFAGPVVVVAHREDNPLTTRNYLPMLLLNLRGSERLVLDSFLQLDKSEWELRSRLMTSIAGFAMDRRDQEELRRDCIAPIRAVLFDSTELPQLRVQALNLLARNWLTIDDVMRLKRVLRKDAPGLRALFADFLNDAF